MKAKPVPRTEAQKEARREIADDCRGWVNCDTPQIVIDAFRAMSEMRGADDNDVRAFALMAWLAKDRARKHEEVAGAFAFHSESRDWLFGQKRFALLNLKHGVFDVIASRRGQLTDAYVLRPAYAEALQAAESESDARDDVVPMIRTDGQRRLPSESRGSGECLSTADSIWRVAEISTVTPVPIDALRKFQADLVEARSAGGPVREIKLQAMGVGITADLDSLTRSIGALLLRARAELPQRGYITTQYRQVSTGRLFEFEPGLQGAPRLIKRVALAGLRSWDIENCHPAIISQLAHRQGLRCPAIDDYLARKDKVRETIAADVGITYLEAKRCLIAMFYGSRHRHDGKGDGISDEIGVEKARVFAAHRLVKALSKELHKVGGLIEQAWPRVEGGCLINAAGMPYCGKQRVAAGRKDTPATRLAHITQGYEVAALHAVVSAFGDRIVLLEHDGWTAREGLDREAMEAEILARTGMHLSVEGKLIQSPAAS